jgi:hypothetical protein
VSSTSVTSSTIGITGGTGIRAVLSGNTYTLSSTIGVTGGVFPGPLTLRFDSSTGTTGDGSYVYGSSGYYVDVFIPGVTLSSTVVVSPILQDNGSIVISYPDDIKDLMQKTFAVETISTPSNNFRVWTDKNPYPSSNVGFAYYIINF